MTTRLLVVDDDESNRMTLGILLEDEGFEVALAAGFAEASRLITDAEVPYRAILLDEHLGDGLGSQLLPLIRERMRGAKVVLISGSSSGEVASPATVDACLPKGSAFEEVLALVHQLTSASRGERPDNT